MGLLKYVGLIGIFLFLSPNAIAGSLCAYTKAGTGNSDQPASATANYQMTLVNTVLCSRFSCPSYQFWQSDKISNASVNRDLSGFIIRYNPHFMNNTQAKYSDYATIGILGHELGHVIDLTLYPTGANRPTREARADEYAGCAFALAGEPKKNLIYLAQTLQSFGPSPGYPTPQQRVQLLAIGYDKCRSISNL